METPTPSQEHAPWNLRDNFEKTKAAIADVERGEWLKHQNVISERWDEVSEGQRDTSLEGARRWLQTVDRSRDDWYTMDGEYGLDRWFIHADGRVRFSGSHASPNTLERARVLGFWIED